MRFSTKNLEEPKVITQEELDAIDKELDQLPIFKNDTVSSHISKKYNIKSVQRSEYSGREEVGNMDGMDK